MINLSQCRKYADNIDDVVSEINTLIIAYEDAYYYINKNESNDSEEFATQIHNETTKLKNIKNDLNEISSKIRQKANQIYNDELEEKKRQEEEKKQEEKNSSN